MSSHAQQRWISLWRYVCIHVRIGELNAVESRNSGPKSSGKFHNSGFWFSPLRSFLFIYILAIRDFGNSGLLCLVPSNPLMRFYKIGKLFSKVYGTQGPLADDASCNESKKKNMRKKIIRLAQSSLLIFGNFIECIMKEPMTNRWTKQHKHLRSPLLRCRM